MDSFCAEITYLPPAPMQILAHASAPRGRYGAQHTFNDSVEEIAFHGDARPVSRRPLKHGDGGHGVGNGRDKCGCGRATADDHDFLVFAIHGSIPLLRMNDLALVTLHSLELRGVALL